MKKTNELKKLDLNAMQKIAGGTFGYGYHKGYGYGGGKGNATAIGLINVGSGNRS